MDQFECAAILQSQRQRRLEANFSRMSLPLPYFLCVLKGETAMDMFNLVNLLNMEETAPEYFDPYFVDDE